MSEKLLTVEMSEDQAWAYALFLYQVGVSDYRAFAADDEEARRMHGAGEAIRQALADAGVVPR